METGTTPSRPGFRKHLRPAVVPGDATYLVSEQGVTAVEGAAMAALAPLLDGSRDLAQLARETRAECSRPASSAAFWGSWPGPTWSPTSPRRTARPPTAPGTPTPPPRSGSPPDSTGRAPTPNCPPAGSGC